MILEQGDRVLVVHRRLFDGDASRYFIGMVEGYESGVARVTGYTWMKDPFAGAMIKKDDPRTKILSLSSGTLIVYHLPPSTTIPSVRFENKDGKLILTDGHELKLDISEVEHAKFTKRS